MTRTTTRPTPIPKVSESERGCPEVGVGPTVSSLPAVTEAPEASVTRTSTCAPPVAAGRDDQLARFGARHPAGKPK